MAGPSPTSLSTIPPAAFPLAKRRPSLFVRPSGRTLPAIRPDPPIMEIGWKRTKPIPLEKPRGYVIVDFLDKLQGLMEKEFGTKDLRAKAGEIVAMRVKGEAEVCKIQHRSFLFFATAGDGPGIDRQNHDEDDGGEYEIYEQDSDDGYSDEY